MTAPVLAAIERARRAWELTEPQTFLDFDELTEREKLTPLSRETVSPAEGGLSGPSRSVSSFERSAALPDLPLSHGAADQRGDGRPSVDAAEGLTAKQPAHAPRADSAGTSVATTTP